MDDDLEGLEREGLINQLKSGYALVFAPLWS